MNKPKFRYGLPNNIFGLSISKSKCCNANTYTAPSHYSTSMDAPTVVVCLKCGHECSERSSISINS